MQITRNSLDTAAGPEDWFTGSVYIDAVAAPSDGSRLSASSVHFTPGARTAWHTHPNGQTIWVIEGVGLCQRRGGADRGDPPRRPRLLRARRGALARRGAEPLHGTPRDARGRRRGQLRDLGRPRQRRRVRGGARYRQLKPDFRRPAVLRPRRGTGRAAAPLLPSSGRGRTRSPRPAGSRRSRRCRPTGRPAGTRSSPRP